MKRTVLFMGILLAVSSTYAQDIFKKHGHNKEMLTLSKGRYKETFINEEVMQIGTVLINTRTYKVITFLEEDTTKVAYKAESTSRFLTIDPLAEKYPEISPYVYCNNNPVNAIDPDGREVIFIIRNNAGQVGRYQYTADGNLRHTGTGKIYSGSGMSGNAGRVVDGYNKMLNSGDKNYVKQVTTLINSKNVHEVNLTEVFGKNSGVEMGSGGTTVSEAKSAAQKGEGIGTTTKFGNLSNTQLENSDVGKTNYTTVAHEVQHQYDYDQGKMKDSFDKEGELIKGQNSPADQRAMQNEDKAREQQNLQQRRIY